MGLRVCLPAAKKVKGMASTDQVNGDVQPLLIGFKQKQGDTSLSMNKGVESLELFNKIKMEARGEIRLQWK